MMPEKAENVPSITHANEKENTLIPCYYIIASMFLLFSFWRAFYRTAAGVHRVKLTQQ